MSRSLNWALLGALLTALAGCGGKGDRPDLGDVSGKVTLDGKPLSGVIVVFKPEAGRAATGTTDAEGRYELEYLYQVKGCKTGPNVVSLEWPLGASGPPIPARYVGGKSELKAEVKAGANTFDFNLEPDKAAPAAPAKKVVPVD